MKGQVSFETMIAVAVLLFFLVVSLAIWGNINENSNSLQTQLEEWNECSKIAGLVQEVFLDGPGTMVEASASQPVQVGNYSVLVGSTSCNFTARVEPVSLSAGTIRVWYSNGKAVLENA